MITQDELKSILHYDPLTGKFTWIKCKAHWVDKGKEAGCICNGYIRIKINQKKYQAHILAWLYMFGVYPEDIIDHINGIRDDNRICNLLLADASSNNWNSVIRKDNKTGIKGVYFIKHLNKYMAYVAKNKVRVYLGLHKTLEEAEQVVIKARASLHGEFAHNG